MKILFRVGWTTAMALAAIVSGGLSAEAAPLRVIQGSYVGDGQPLRFVETAGLDPEVILMQGRDGAAALLKTPTMPDPLSKSMAVGVAPVSDGVVSLGAGGFYVSGVGARANTVGVTYHWVAFEGGVGEMAYGSYVGDGVDKRPIVGLGMQPSYVMVLPSDAQDVQHRYSFESANQSQLLTASGAKADRIQDFLPDGFELGKNNAVNKPSVRFDWVAWSDLSANFAQVQYTGSGSPIRSVTGMGIQPSFVLVESDDNTGAAVARWESMSTSRSAYPIGGVGPTDALVTLDPDGFTVGWGQESNWPGVSYYGVGIQASEVLDLAVTKVVDNPSPFPGDTIVYTITVDNPTLVPATNVAVRDSLPAGLMYQWHSASTGLYDPGTGMWSLPSVGNGNQVTLQLAARVAAGSLGQVIVNQADLLAVDQIDTVRTNDSAQAGIVVGIAAATVDIAVAVTLDNSTPAVGDTLLVTVDAENLGADTATGAQIQVRLPAELTLVSATPSQGSYLNGDWLVGTLNSGALASLKLLAVVRDGSAGNGGRVEALLSQVDQLDAVLSNNTAAADFVVSWVDVEVHAGFDVTRPLEGQTLRLVTYARNLSPFDAFGVSLRDSLPAELALVSSTASAGSYDSLSGIWNLGTLAGGGLDSLVIFATVTSGGNISPFGVLAELVAVVPGDVDAANDASAALLQMAQVDLSLSKVADRNQTLEAEIVNFTITVTNQGPDVATGIVVQDVLPPSLVYVGAVPSRGVYSAGNGRWDGFDLGVGEQASLDLSARVALGTAGTLVTNVASVLSRDQLERNPTDDAASASVQVVAVANAAISVTAQPQSGGAMIPGADPGIVLQLQVLNQGPVGETLDGLTFTNLAAGAGNQNDLDASWGGLRLGIGADVVAMPLIEPEFVDGQLVFDGLGLALPVGKPVQVVLWGAASLSARDSDLLDVSVEAEKDLRFAGTPTLSAGFPLSPFASWTVDGMSAAQIQLADLGSSTFLAGSSNNLALALVVPPNGYESDVITKINVVNAGDAEPGADLAALRAWADDGDATFDAQTDTLLGDFVFTGSRWELTGLSLPVRVAGRAIFVSVDVAELALPGRSIRLALPSGQDAALGMWSGNDGPVDRPVASPGAHAITAPDRVSLTAVPVPPGSVDPGTQDVVALQISFANSYAIDQVLSELQVANATVGAGSQSELDGEIAAVTLREDGDGDGVLGAIDVDPELGRSFFQAGVATFSGLNWTLGAGTSAQLFVTFDVDARKAADSDALAAQVMAVTDVLFEGDASLAASWPLNSEASWLVDGMLASQVSQWDVPSVALGPGEGPALAFDLLVPANGYQGDVLNGITVDNGGSAVAGDLSDVRLWRDGGDGGFDAGAGDDLDLGAMVALAGSWQSVLLNETVNAPGARFFVGVSTSAAPTDSATVSFRVPIDGITMASGNDGPRDAAVVNTSAVLLSQAPLLAQIEVAPEATTVGNAVSVRMIVRNVSGETVTGITPSALSVVGDPAVGISSGPLPASFDLAVAARDTFVWSFDAIASGQAQLSANASGTGVPSSIVRVSLPALSNAVQVFTQADSLGLSPVVTSSFSVNRGQSNVVPMSLTFGNPAGAGGSDILLTGLRVRLESNQGADIVPSSLLSRVVVNEGTQLYLDKSALESSGSEIDLTLATPARVIPQEPATLNLQLDLLPTTVVPDFRVVLTQSTWVSAEDANSGAPIVSYLQSGSFPVASGLATVLAEAESLSVAPMGLADFDAGAGQTGLLAGVVDLTNVGVTGLTSDIRASRCRFSLIDGSGARVGDPGSVLSKLEVRSTVQSYAVLPLSAGQDSVIVVDLSPQISAPVNAPLPVELRVDTRPDAPLGSYRLRFEDAATFEAADAITRTPVSVAYTSTPLQGPSWNLQAPAMALRVSGSGGLPATGAAGATDLRALELRLRHAGSTETAAVHVDSLRVRAFDESRQPVPLGAFVNAFRVLWGDSLIANLAVPGAAGPSFEMAIPTQTLAAGDTATVQLRLDVAAAAPPGSIELLVDDMDVAVHDANTGNSIAVVADGSGALPVSSGLMRLVPASTQLSVDLSGMAPATLVAGQTQVRLASVRLENPALVGSSEVLVRGLTLRAADRENQALALGAVLSAVRLFDGAVEVAVVSGLDGTSNTADLSFPDIGVAAAAAKTLELRGDLQDVVVVAGVRFGVGVGDVQVVSPGVAVNPAAGRTFPMYTEPSSLGAAQLAASYANFPNPFKAGRESTAFAYYLDAPAAVTLRVYTLTGETVITVLDRETRGAGMHQSDRWDGLNGDGQTLRNGVYLARILVEYDDGRSEELLRRVAVVR